MKVFNISLPRQCGLLLILLLSACDSTDNSASSQLTTLSGVAVVRVHDVAKVAQGSELYGRFCTECHGIRAEGAPDWRQVDATGAYPPPPLNGSGHAWHHPRAMLHTMIKHGSPRDDQGRSLGNMPAWQGKLSDAEIDAIIEWFQSLWPDQVYAIWYDRQQ